MSTSASHRHHPTRRGILAAALAAVAIVLALALPGRARAADATFGFVVHAKVKVSSLSASEVKDIFSGRTSKWPGGQRIVLVLPPKGSAEMRWLSKKVLGMPEEVYRRYVLQKVFRGEMKKPIFAKSVEDAIEEASSTRGGITPATLDGLADEVKRVTLR
jgi:hypothetical protein